MEREEIEAMWERIKALEENSLKGVKGLACLLLDSIVGVVGSMTPLGDRKKYFNYMEPKLNKAFQEFNNAQSIDEVLQIMKRYTEDLNFFTRAL